MSWLFDLAVLAVFVLMLGVMPWKRPHPNHVFALDMLRPLADEDSEPQSESRGVAGDNHKHGDHAA